MSPLATEVRSLRCSARLLSVGFIGMCALGCASAGVASLSYEPPEPLEVENKAFVPMPFDQVWDDLVGKLATQFYVINNIGKESRLINLSFTSNEPEKYVTGGMTTREFNRRVGSQKVSYDPAADSSYKTGWTWGSFNNLPATGTYSRRTSLEGRANIFLAPEADGVRVTVNCRYVLSVMVTGTYVAKNAFGTTRETGVTPSSNATAAFNTNVPETVDWGVPGQPQVLTFRSTGKFERDILSLLPGQ